MNCIFNNWLIKKLLFQQPIQSTHFMKFEITWVKYNNRFQSFSDKILSFHHFFEFRINISIKKSLFSPPIPSIQFVKFKATWTEYNNSFPILFRQNIVISSFFSNLESIFQLKGHHSNNRYHQFGLSSLRKLDPNIKFHFQSISDKKP